MGGQARWGSIDTPLTEIAATALPSYNGNIVYPGQTGKSAKGAVGPFASAVAIGVPGDVAYFIVPAPNLDNTDPDMQLFNATYSISPDVADSPLIKVADDGSRGLDLQFRPLDEQGRFGVATVLTLTILPHAPVGPMLIALEWDTPVDLDLHVESPAPGAKDGTGRVDISPKAPTGTKAGLIGVSMDLDSNAGCAIDNRNREEVRWSEAPMPGRYVVRVDPYSLCGCFSVGWHVAAYRAENGNAPFDEATGIFTLDGSRRQVGTGLTVLEFDYP